jgi:hypothetical protein
LRNSVDLSGVDTSADNDPTLYGWRLYGDEGVIVNLTNGYPTYYAFKLMQSFIQPGDTVLNATSDYMLLAAYAARRADGSLTLLVINKDSTTNFNAQIALTGFAPYATANVAFYGMPQDNAAETGVGSLDAAWSSFAGAATNFTWSFPPLSLTLFTFPPAAPRLVLMPPAPRPGGQFIAQLQGQSGTYILQSSTNLTVWTPVATNTLSGTSLSITNPVPAGPGAHFWRAVWQP